MVLIAAIVAIATGSIPLGLLVLVAAGAVLGLTALVRGRARSARTPH